ncbi:MAG: 30S ribosomal protein S24e [Candidatus Thermoplasmatota archaeon]|nr:30S ribosomal protein S24e [Candidatus Thermoplasmatota archaeon]MCL5731283.1 30S ribosomal protein S24e [Candidatus Thermoplasmatota archaeon]
MVRIEFRNTRDNALLKRKEIHYVVSFDGESTPKREAIRQMIARNVGVAEELVIVDRTVQETGKAEATGYAKVYSSRDDAMLYEPDYELIRNGLKDKEKKE